MNRTRGATLPHTFMGLVAVALVLLTCPAGAQESTPASPLLPPEHWAVEAAARLDALGLAPDYLPAERSVPRRAVAELLRTAEIAAAERQPSVAPLVASWMNRFQEEFPEFSVDSVSLAPRMLGSATAAGFVYSHGRMGPGLYEFPPQRTGGLELPDQREPWGEVSVSVLPANLLALSVSPALDSGGVHLAGWEAHVAWRSWSLVAGRGPVGYGMAEGGGVLLSGRSALDRVQIATRSPLSLPGVLQVLGPVSAHVFASRLPEERHPGAPLFMGMRLAVRPHPRFTLAGQRATLMGGDGPIAAVTPGNVLKALVGKYGFIEDQVASVEFRYRLPTEDWLASTLYCEWGAEDTAGAFTDVPGVTCGTLFPALPKVPNLAAGVEYAYFGGRCCGNPPWYRHNQFPGGWALSETPLGHPVGGEGQEWLGYMRGSFRDARLRVEGRIFHRERAGENLFVPGREGASLGLAGEAAWRFTPRSEVRFSAYREHGEDWAETRLAIISRLFF